MRPSSSVCSGLMGFAACILAATGALAADRHAAPPQPGERFALPGVVVLKLAEDPGHLPAIGKTGVAVLDQALAHHTLAALEPVSRRPHPISKPGVSDISRIFFARYADGAPPEQVAGELAKLAGIVYAEPVWEYPLDVDPNDTNYSIQQINLQKMQFPDAWDITKGENGSVLVGLVDGGTWWQHLDLVDNIWTNPGEIPGNQIDDDGNGYVDDVHGWNFGNETGDPTGLPSAPQSGQHGTHTAGIVSAITNNSRQVAGASWNAKVMPVCAADPTSDGTIGAGYPGILYAAENGANVINLSWGGLGGP